MDNKILLDVFIGASAIILGIIVYVKALKKKMRRFVLRNEKIKNYFK